MVAPRALEGHVMQHFLRPGVAAAVAVVAVGSLLAAVAPTSQQLQQPFATLTALLGWCCFVAWSLSFYPQIVVNHTRKSVVGLSLDYTALNLLGHTSYAVYTCNMWWNSRVISEYQTTHHTADRAVHLNDVVFALHAVVLMFIMAAQAVCMDRGQQTVSKPCITGVAASLLLVVAYALALLLCSVSGCSVPVSILGLMYVIGTIKIGVTLVKYVPQVWLNYTRKSTEGWSELNVLLDLTGGGLSLAQILLVCSVTGDWARVTGNPITIGLAVVSLAFDLVFVWQHYVLYGPALPYTLGAQQEGQLQTIEVQLHTRAEDWCNGEELQLVARPSSSKESPRGSPAAATLQGLLTHKTPNKKTYAAAGDEEELDDTKLLHRAHVTSAPLGK